MLLKGKKEGIHLSWAAKRPWKVKVIDNLGKTDEAIKWGGGEPFSASDPQKRGVFGVDSYISTLGQPHKHPAVEDEAALISVQGFFEPDKIYSMRSITSEIPTSPSLLRSPQMGSSVKGSDTSAIHSG